MVIKVRLFATFRIGRGKEVFLDLEEGSKVNIIFDKLNIPLEEVSILLVNGRDSKHDRVLSEGDVVSIFPPVGGG